MCKKGWSCCRPRDLYTFPTYRELMNLEAYNKNSKGCKHLETHVEDENYTLSASKFPVLSDVATSDMEPKPIKHKEIEKHDEPFYHKVLIGDTLMGISLKYGISVSFRHLFFSLNLSTDR